MPFTKKVSVFCRSDIGQLLFQRGREARLRALSYGCSQLSAELGPRPELTRAANAGDGLPASLSTGEYSKEKFLSTGTVTEPLGNGGL